jgi:hypothetical protein
LFTAERAMSFMSKLSAIGFSALSLKRWVSPGAGFSTTRTLGAVPGAGVSGLTPGVGESSSVNA